jgi:hypothetical protein
MKRQTTSDKGIYIPLIRPFLVMGVILVLVQLSHVSEGLEMVIQLMVVLGIYAFLWIWMVLHYR